MKTIEVWFRGEPFTLERNVHGMWTTFVIGCGYLQADTIEGIFNLLRKVA